jgi:hypothetical protein
MLGLSNTLNTSKIYSKNVRDITMNNEQVALYNPGHLRDYTGVGTLLLAFSKGCLRYSPLFCGDKLPLNLCKLLKTSATAMRVRVPGRARELSISRHLEDKLDPN